MLVTLLLLSRITFLSESEKGSIMIVDNKNYLDLEVGTVLIMERGVDGQEGYGKIIVEVTDKRERSPEKIDYDGIRQHLTNRWTIVTKS